MNTQTQTPETNPAQLLYQFAHQRPGLDPRDYGGGREGWLSYRRESAEITRDLSDFRELYALAWDILGDDLPELVTAYLTTNSGRLTLKGNALEYITGQYFPTEYRPAASRCLVSLIWRKFTKDYPEYTGDQIRKAIKKRVSRRVANNYFR